MERFRGNATWGEKLKQKHAERTKERESIYKTISVVGQNEKSIDLGSLLLRAV